MPPSSKSRSKTKSKPNVSSGAPGKHPEHEDYPWTIAVQDHHGGGLWLKDDQGWFLVKNTAGIEWSAQFCADPTKVDQLRLNARRLYSAFPDAVTQLVNGKNIWFFRSRSVSIAQ